MICIYIYICIGTCRSSIGLIQVHMAAISPLRRAERYCSTIGYTFSFTKTSCKHITYYIPL